MQIIKTKITRPPRICVYGPHGIGKSTFGVSCPSPIFIQTEDGLEGLETEAFPVAGSFDDVISALEYLRTKEHSYKTIVVDSLDWLEKLIFSRVCLANNITDIAKLSYGRGYSEAMEHWGTFLDYLEILNKEKKMIVVLLAHAKIEKFEDPERENYDRYSLDLQKKASGMISEWVDILGFANYKIITTTQEGGFGQKSIKAKGSGKRQLNLEEKPAFTAKNRYSLPEVIELDWKVLQNSFPKKTGNLVKVKEERETEKQLKEK